jgi:hypothetical protein
MEAITQLQKQFHYTLQLFYYLKEQQDQNNIANLLVEQYLSAFSFMKEQLSRLFNTETANTSQQQQQQQQQQQHEQQILEKYSDALLSLVTQKLNKSFVSNNQTQGQ